MLIKLYGGVTMATRARIGIMLDDGKIISSYHHWDGYPGGLGYNLVENWNNEKKVIEAIKMGDASKWGYFIGYPIGFDDRDNPLYDYQNVYYGRDRGEKVTTITFENEEEFLKSGFDSGEEYIYLAKIEGKEQKFSKDKILSWYYTEIDIKEFRPLERKAVRDHISIMQRYLELGEKGAL